MRYKIEIQCFNKITQFYNNVARKYCHTYSYELMCKNIDDAIDGMYKIENGLMRRTPTLERWKIDDHYMSNTKKWYYLYKIEHVGEEDVVTVVDVCHSQNMHESKKFTLNQLKHFINECVREVLKENKLVS